MYRFFFRVFDTVSKSKNTSIVFLASVSLISRSAWRHFTNADANTDRLTDRPTDLLSEQQFAFSDRINFTERLLVAPRVTAA